MDNKSFFTLIFSVSLLFVSCATPQFSKSVDHLNDKTEGSSDEIANKAEHLEFDRLYPVELSVRKLPPGLSWNSEGKLVSGSAKYVVLGQVLSTRKEDKWAALGKSIYWYIDMHDKHSGFRDGYCKAQLPLRLLTALLWSITPFQWPCFGWHFDDNGDYLLHQQELKRLVFAMGGNRVYVKDHDTNTSLEGWAVKALP